MNEPEGSPNDSGKATLLLVDDEPHILKVLGRLFVRAGYKVLSTGDPHEAAALARTERVDVVLSDNMMPIMRGTELLERIKSTSPCAERILMTGYADLSAAIDAINRCEVFRFVLKPWDDGELLRIVADALEKGRLVRSLSRADERTLLGLAQAVELKDPYTRGHCDRVAKIALTLAEAIGIEGDRLKNIKSGCWLHDCGKIGVPEAVLNKPDRLTEEEFALVRNHSAWGAQIAAQAGLHKTVHEIILYHHERFDGSGYPVGLRGEEIPPEARIVALSDVFDALTSERSYRPRMDKAEAIRTMREMAPTHFEPALFATFLEVLG